MFEKEAEQIANKRCGEIRCFGHCSFSSPKHHRCGEWHREYNCAKEGIEYGYNKANKWYYVKDEKMPKFDEETEIKFLKGKYTKAERIVICLCEDNDYQNIYAWKEIVLPKEIE